MIAVEIPKIVIKESNKEVPNKYRNAKFGSQMASGTSRCREIKKVIKGDDIYKKKCPTSWFPANISFNINLRITIYEEEIKEKTLVKNRKGRR